jgi:hypothetical protein
MNWGVIPAIFFDLIGRIVPSSLLMVLAVLIARGYREGIEDILKQASQVSTAASFFTLIVVAYFVDILMKQLWINQLWELPAAPEKGRGIKREWDRKDRDDLQKIYDDIRATGMTETGAPVVSLPDAEIVLRMIQRCLPVEGYRPSLPSTSIWHVRSWIPSSFPWHSLLGLPRNCCRRSSASTLPMALNGWRKRR